MDHEPRHYESGVQVMMEVIGAKWKIPILHQLLSGRKRTGELLHAIPGITQKVLTQQLRSLEKDGLVHRIVYRQIPPKVEYEISEYGLSLKETMVSLCDWGERHLDRLHGSSSPLLDNHYKDLA